MLFSDNVLSGEVDHDESLKRNNFVVMTEACSVLTQRNSLKIRDQT